MDGLASSQTADVLLVTQIISHPSYMPSSNYANVAIVKLHRNVRLREGIIEIAILDSSDATHTGHVATVNGWNNGLLLRSASVTVLSTESCAVRYPGFNGPTLMCAGNMDQTPCNGDEGAPLAMAMMGVHTVIGIYSHIREGDCTQGVPAAYTRVNAYYGWISVYA